MCSPAGIETFVDFITGKVTALHNLHQHDASLGTMTSSTVLLHADPPFFPTMTYRFRGRRAWHLGQVYNA
jgi:hypothetical protein